MNIKPNEVRELIQEQILEVVAACIEEAAKASSQHERKSAVSLSIKIAHDSDNPSLLIAEWQVKRKEPVKDNEDRTVWTDAATLHMWDISEAQGQLRMPIEKG